MSKPDFFSFITSLKPIELKAMGELSHVLHLDEGATVYSTGDESDALYIINRGAVEVIHEHQRHAARISVSYLSRGDIFGEMDVLTNSSRKNAIRTCEPVSLQVFKKRDFSELIRRVPSFFFYISQQLANQVLKVSDMAFIQSNCLELSGNLANFDLVTIYQTILNSAQSGELAIANDLGETVALFTFKEGQAHTAQFYHLTGEEAFWQLFLHDKLSGTFSFSISESAFLGGAGEPIRRNPTDLLITALQYRDEFKLLLDDMPDPVGKLSRLKLNFDWSDPAPEELRPLAEAIWQICYSSPYCVEELYQHIGCCELKFYKVLRQLLSTGHFALLLPGEERATPPCTSITSTGTRRILNSPAAISSLPLRASPAYAVAS